MRISVTFLLAALILSTRGVTRADDRAYAHAIIAKAIRAAGGEEKLAHYQAQTWKENATFFGAGPTQQYEASYAAEWPDKFLVEIQGEFTMVLNGDKGWVRTKSKTRDMSKAELEEHREGVYSFWVISLLPLRDGAFKLTALGDKRVLDRPTAGIRVSRKGHSDLSLYFDKETGLLARMDTRFKEARTGKEINQETTFCGYTVEAASGTRSPTKISINRDGKHVVEAHIDLKHIEKIDGRIFARP
jgi:hypothetical protein